MRRQLGRTLGVLAFSILAIGITAGAAWATDEAPPPADPGVVVITGPGPDGPGPKVHAASSTDEAPPPADPGVVVITGPGPADPGPKIH